MRRPHLRAPPFYLIGELCEIGEVMGFSGIARPISSPHFLLPNLPHPSLVPSLLHLITPPPR